MTDRACLGNPCDEQGNTLPCEAPNCANPSKFRRQLPRRARTGLSGDVFLMGSRGPVYPRRRADIEVVCGQHLTDWRYGPLTAEDT